VPPLVVALMSVKGGVGKTTAAVNLAYLAAERGAGTLLWDLDPQGASTYLLRADVDAASMPACDPTADVLVTDYERIDVLRNANAPGEPERLVSGAVRQGIEQLGPWYDVVLFDCAAGLDVRSREVASVADVILVPVLPSPLGVRTLEQLDAFVAGSGLSPEIFPFFSLVDRRRRLHRETVQALQVDRPATLSAQIVDAAIVERMGARREPVVAFAPDSGVAHGYCALWNELCDRLGINALDARATRVPS
jgi:cellulose biosynthesis protein BcsQ